MQTKLYNLSSINIFIDNLTSLVSSENNLASYKKISRIININLSTIKSWMCHKRAPLLKTIDKIANILGCYSFQLLKLNGNLNDIGIHNNNSALLFAQNIQEIFNINKAFSILEKCQLINNAYTDDGPYITETMLRSYLRKDMRRVPSLILLDYMAKSLSLNTYTLISPKSL